MHVLTCLFFITYVPNYTHEVYEVHRYITVTLPLHYRYIAYEVYEVEQQHEQHEAGIPRYAVACQPMLWLDCSAQQGGVAFSKGNGAPRIAIAGDQLVTVCAWLPSRTQSPPADRRPCPAPTHLFAGRLCTCPSVRRHRFGWDAVQDAARQPRALRGPHVFWRDRGGGRV